MNLNVRLLESSFWWTEMWRLRRRGRSTVWMKVMPFISILPTQNTCRRKSSRRFSMHFFPKKHFPKHHKSWTNLYISNTPPATKGHTWSITVKMCSGWQCALWSPLCRFNGGRCASDACLWRNLPLPCKCEEPQRKGTSSKHCLHSRDLV